MDSELLPIFISKLHMNLVDFELTTSPSTYSYGRKKCHLS